MKATLDIPDSLYRRVKAKSALAGRPVRDVAIALFAEWVDLPAETDLLTEDYPVEMPPWFGAARPYAAKVERHDMEAVRESIADARYKS